MLVKANPISTKAEYGNQVRRKSSIVDLLARTCKPMSTGAIAKALDVELGQMCTRVRQLEQSRRLKSVGTATRTRDVRWTLVDPADMKAPVRPISFGGDQCLAAMREICRARLLAGLSGDWQTQQEVMTDGCA